MIKTKLLQARLDNGFSQEKLADLIGMSQTSYSRRENGLKNILAVEWAKIAKVLNVNKDDIYEKNTQIPIYKNIIGNNFRNETAVTIPKFTIEYLESLKA